MIFGSLMLAMLLAGTPADVVTVRVPAKGSVSLALTPSGKADIERNGTVSRIHVELDKLQSPQRLAPALNTYVVWAVSSEGGFENVGELGVSDGKGRLDATTRFDQFGILVTGEPHFMVDRPNSAIAFRNLPPKADDIRYSSVSVNVGFYDYSTLQPAAAGVPAMVAEARMALQLAAGVQADRYAESDFRRARVDVATLEDMLGRSTPLDLLTPVANESIRLSQMSFVHARENAAASELESAKSDLALLRRDAQQAQDRMQRLTNEHASALDQVRQLNADLAAATGDKQQALAERDAALMRIQGMEKDLADLRHKQDDLQNASMVNFPADYFDVPGRTMTPAGSDALAKLAVVAGLWSEPVRVACPANAVEILKQFLPVAGVSQDRVVIIPGR